MNRIVLMGRVCRDIELRHTQSGTPVASFPLAVDRPRSKDAEVKTDFIDCVAWRGTGEFIAKYFSKGQRIAIEGRLQIKDWTDKEGNKRKSAEVVVDTAYFCESKKNSDTATSNYQNFEETDENDDGLPF